MKDIKESSRVRWLNYKETHKKPVVYTMKERSGYCPNVDNIIFGLKSLTARQKYLYFYMSSNCFEKYKATIETMAECAGYARSSFNEDLNRLCDFGVIKKISCKQKSKTGIYRKGSCEKKNDYIVLPSSDWAKIVFKKERDLYLLNKHPFVKTWNFNEAESTPTISVEKTTETISQPEPLPHGAETVGFIKMMKEMDKDQLEDFFIAQICERTNIDEAEWSAFDIACEAIGVSLSLVEQAMLIGVPISLALSSLLRDSK
jgi:predicted transcriptional regulator